MCRGVQPVRSRKIEKNGKRARDTQSKPLGFSSAELFIHQDGVRLQLHGQTDGLALPEERSGDRLATWMISSHAGGADAQAFTSDGAPGSVSSSRTACGMSTR